MTPFRLVLVVILSAAAPACREGSAADPIPPEEIFARRILPLGATERASSCRECHAAGVDLAQYVLPDEADTFAALQAAGLVNVDRPADSKLLQFIGRKPAKEDAVMARVRVEESAAFGAWIAYAAKNPEFRDRAAPATPIGPTVPVEVVRYGRMDRVLQSFVENIWIERERCQGCHTAERNARLVAKHGPQISWMTENDPAATLSTLIAHDLIDAEKPDRSTFLLKPLNEVEHGGHVKFARGSRSDAQFRRFLHDYADVVAGKFKTASELPKPTEEVLIATGQQMRVTGLPLVWAGRLVRVVIHRRTGDGWSERPVGTADSTISPQGQWQNPVFAVLPRSEAAAAELLRERRLPGERYLARIYVDGRERAKADRNFAYEPTDLLGEVEFEGPWPPGYKPPKIIAAPSPVSKPLPPRP